LSVCEIKYRLLEKKTTTNYENKRVCEIKYNFLNDKIINISFLICDCRGHAQVVVDEGETGKPRSRMGSNGDALLFLRFIQ
jgi:hypothetical protein